MLFRSVFRLPSRPEGFLRTGLIRNLFPHRVGRAYLAFARKMMRDLKNGEVYLVEGSHFTVLARRALEKYAHGALFQFLLLRKPNTPEVVALFKHFDAIKVAFGANASLPHYATDRFLAAAHSLEAKPKPPTKISSPSGKTPTPTSPS